MYTAVRGYIHPMKSVFLSAKVFCYFLISCLIKFSAHAQDLNGQDIVLIDSHQKSSCQKVLDVNLRVPMLQRLTQLLEDTGYCHVNLTYTALKPGSSENIKSSIRRYLFNLDQRFYRSYYFSFPKSHGTEWSHLSAFLRSIIETEGFQLPRSPENAALLFRSILTQAYENGWKPIFYFENFNAEPPELRESISQLFIDFFNDSGIPPERHRALIILDGTTHPNFWGNTKYLASPMYPVMSLDLGEQKP